MNNKGSSVYSIFETDVAVNFPGHIFRNPQNSQHTLYSGVLGMMCNLGVGFRPCQILSGKPVIY